MSLILMEVFMWQAPTFSEGISCAHTILLGLILSGKETRKPSPTGRRYWGSVSSGAFGTHQRITLAKFLSCFSHACHRVPMKKEKGEEGGKV